MPEGVKGRARGRVPGEGGQAEEPFVGGIWEGGGELSSINLHWFYGSQTTTETSNKRVTQNFDLEDTGDESENCWSEYCTGYGTAFGGAKVQASLGGALMDPTEMGDTCELQFTVGLPGDVLGASLGISFSPDGDFKGLRASLNVGLGASPGTSVHYASCTVGNGVFSSLLERSLYSGARVGFKSCADLVVEKLRALSPLCGKGLGEKCLQAVDAAAKMLHVASDGKVLAESNEAELLRKIIMPDSVSSDTLSGFELPKQGQPAGTACRLERGSSYKARWAWRNARGSAATTPPVPLFHSARHIQIVRCTTAHRARWTRARGTACIT